MIRPKQDGEDLVFVAVDRSNAAAVTEAFRVNGNTGKVTLASFASSQLLDDYWDKSAADGAAATATAEHTFMRAAGPITIAAVRYVPDAALTADNTNFAAITVTKRNADGTGNVTVATRTTAITDSGNWLQWVAVNLPLTVANINLAAGQILTVKITKSGAGVVVPAGSLQLDYVLA
jgi:hypothetical protein